MGNVQQAAAMRHNVAQCGTAMMPQVLILYSQPDGFIAD
jgi:hypothetical protein